MSEVCQSLRSDVGVQREPVARTHGAVTSSLVAFYCATRSLPFLFASIPKTPLRVLCLIAFDTRHTLRTSALLSCERLRVLATFLDLAASENAALDRKEFDSVAYRSNLQQLEQAGMSLELKDHLRQIRELEERRPLAGGDDRRFDEVRLYREAVARQHLSMAASIARRHSYDLSPRHEDGDMEMLFRMVMQCQILDDLLDYRKDVSFGLPSFLTASASLTESINLTAEASQEYRCLTDHPRLPNTFPFRAALLVVSVLTRLAIRSFRSQSFISVSIRQRDRTHETCFDSTFARQRWGHS